MSRERDGALTEILGPAPVLCRKASLVGSYSKAQWSSGSVSCFRTTAPGSIPGVARSTQPFIPTAVGR
ncbi:hypothetical protein TNCV_1889341 [Trichonephila clavipes]|nr:hypothetical protein TNCV_1889341 [Trichonephila clavipes]